MSDARNDPLADVINVLAAPIAGGIRSIEQFQRGVGELLRAVENLNTTLETLNETATRVNRLVEDVEEPIRAMMPQLTRSIRAADEMTQLLEGPIRAAAPNIEKISDTLSSPGFSTLPTQLGEFMAVVGEASKRLAPLTQFAENAGGLFGGFKFPGVGGAAKPTASSTPAPSGAAPQQQPRAAEQAPAKTTAKKPAQKRAASKRVPAERAAAKKAPTKKASPKRSSAADE